MRPLTPDFIDHAWQPLTSATLRADGFVALTWADGTDFAAYGPWLAENVEGFGLELQSRESMLEPRDLPLAADLVDARLTAEGALAVRWADGRGGTVHPGWLRHVADGRHLPTAVLPEPRMWTAADLPEPPTINGAAILHDDSVFEAWLAALVEYGLCRLTDTPADPDFLGELVRRIGPIRSTNFGEVWSVQAKPNPDSTAYTRLDLGQHTDLPTREVPPGFQFLHCVENTVAGGSSRMTDGLAVAQVLQRDHPDVWDTLCTVDWLFCNRATDAEHRWVGPIVDLGGPHQPLTFRAFYPVRSAPLVGEADVPRAYDALRVFSRVCHDPALQIAFPFRPGDLVGFDNRRVLHGRDAFESGGSRHLRGTYTDHDDLYSRLRVLRRRQFAQE